MHESRSAHQCTIVVIGALSSRKVANAPGHLAQLRRESGSARQRLRQLPSDLGQSSVSAFGPRSDLSQLLLMLQLLPRESVDLRLDVGCRPARVGVFGGSGKRKGESKITHVRGMALAADKQGNASVRWSTTCCEHQHVLGSFG